LEGLGMENFGVFAAIWYLYCYFGTFCSNLLCLWPFWYIFPNFGFCAKKNLATLIGY
jgi:hypothetical protein